jgi:hypothetical protein
MIGLTKQLCFNSVLNTSFLREQLRGLPESERENGCLWAATEVLVGADM